MRGGVDGGGRGGDGCGGAINPRNLHLKKELTQIRKAARLLRDPGTTSSWRSPRNSARSHAKNHHFHHRSNGGSSSQHYRHSPLQVVNGNNFTTTASVNNYGDVNPVKKQSKVFLYNWRNSQKSESEGRQIFYDDFENAKDDKSSSTTPKNIDDDSLSDRYGPAIFKRKDSNFTSSIRHKNKSTKRGYHSNAGFSRDAKYILEGISDIRLGRDQPYETGDFRNFDGLRRESTVSPLLSRFEDNKVLKRCRKVDDSISNITPSFSTGSYKYGVKNPSTIESWEATTPSFDDEVDDHLDLLRRSGCGIPCYWSKTSRSSPSLSDTLRKKGTSIFGGSQSSSQRRHHRSSLMSNKRRQSSKTAAKGLLPLLSADSLGGSSTGSEKSDNDLSVNFPELDSEASTRLDRRRWSTSCRSQEVAVEENSLENIKSLSQKYRPVFFDELVGQKMVVKSLKGTISKGRVAPFYLFQGPRGTGKTSTARIFAAALNCLAAEETKPCGVCKDCADFISGKRKDYQEINVSNKNGVDRIKNHLRNLSAVSSSFVSQYKVFIIKECHLLHSKTWMAFCRFLENPLPRVVLILVTTDSDNIPRTILSRCQIHLFNKISNGDIITRLSRIANDENIDVEENALDLIASNADGSLQDAETLLEQFSLLGKRVTASLVNELIGVVSDDKLLVLLEYAMSSNTTETVIKARELMDSGVDPIALMSQLASLIVDIIAGTHPSINTKNVSDRELEKLKHALKLLSEAEKHLRVSTEQSTWFTATLLQLGSIPSPDLTQAGTSQRPNFKTNEELQVNALIDIWEKCVAKCHSRTLRHLLHTYGKLVSITEVQGGCVAYIAFADRDIKTRAEGFLSSITNAFEIVLLRNVQVNIILLPGEANLVVDSRQVGPSEPGTGDDPVQRIEAIIEEQRLETARLLAMENGVLGSVNHSKPERNQILPQDGSFRQNNELNRDIKALKIKERIESRADDVARRISPYSISPSLLHNKSFANNLSRDRMGYESGSVAAAAGGGGGGGGGCGGFFCWNKSKPHRREKANHRTPTRRHKTGQFSCFGECARLRNCNRYKR